MIHYDIYHVISYHILSYLFLVFFVTLSNLVSGRGDGHGMASASCLCCVSAASQAEADGLQELLQELTTEIWRSLRSLEIEMMEKK